MASSSTFTFKREPRTASEEGGTQLNPELSLWGNIKEGFKEGWNQDPSAQSSSTGSSAMSTTGTSTSVEADQHATETIAWKQSQLLKSKGLETRFGELERIQKDLMYYLRKPVLKRGEFTEKLDKMVEEGRVGVIRSVVASGWLTCIIVPEGCQRHSKRLKVTSRKLLSANMHVRCRSRSWTTGLRLGTRVSGYGCVVCIQPMVLKVLINSAGN